MDFQDINFRFDQVNSSGIASVIYYVTKEEIASFPTIIDDDLSNEATPATFASYEGDFTLQGVKKWKKMYSTQGKGKITFESTGETDCKMYLNKGEFSYPRITEEARAYAKAAANGDLVHVIKHDGKFYVIGSPDYRSTMNITGDSGDASGSNNGFQKKKAGEKLPESSENLLEYRTDGSDAFDTLAIGCCIFPYYNRYYFGPSI